jgi:hypothetical protein
MLEFCPEIVELNGPLLALLGVKLRLHIGLNQVLKKSFMKELSYTDKLGNTVFTSEYLRKKGTCCRSGCLHCPYGFTLKKFGFTFKSSLEAASEFQTLISESDFDLSSYTPENRLVIYLKQRLCGALVKNHIVIKKFWLLPEFSNQGITKEYLESYLFS